MPWFRVDDKLGEHPKVRAIPRSRRRNAMGLWLLAGAWCALNLRDGHVPPFMLEEFCSKETDAAALVAVGLWHEAGHDCPDCPQPRDEGGFVFHDWESLQYTREQVLAKREADAQRQAEWRARKRAEKEAQSRDSHNVTGAESQARNATVHLSRPVPSRPVLTTEGGQRTETLRAADATKPPHNPTRCKDHQTTDTPPPCRGCKTARETHERDSKRTRLSIVADCATCGGTGWIEDADGNPARRCTHRSAL